MAACFKPASPAAGPATWPSAGRRGYRGGAAGGGGGGGGGPAYDPDAAVYIASTGELFPKALNVLVLGIKAAGLWDDHIGSIKKAIGVPSLAASMVDLRNPNLLGDAINAPGHSATEGWIFTSDSSQSIDTNWRCGAVDSKGTQDSVHVGMRIIAASGGHPGSVDSASASNRLGFEAFNTGIQRWFGNDGTTLQSAENPATPAHYIGVRSSASARALYKDGSSLGNDSQASQIPASVNVLIGARHRHGGIVDAFLTGRLELWHAGAGLTAAQSSALVALFNAYCAATVPSDGFDGLDAAPVIGVGMKRLYSAYAGPLLRLVRSVDDAEMDFGVDQFGNLDFLAIASWAGGSALLGKRWYNQFGGDDYVQTVKASMPRFSPMGINGAPCFVFDGGNDYMKAFLSNPITGTDLFAAALMRTATGVANFDGIVNGAAISDLNDFQSATSCTVNWGTGGTVILYRSGAQSTTAVGTASVDANVVATGRISGGNLYAGANGTEAAGEATAGNLNIEESWVGARFYNDVPNNQMPVALAGVAMFGGDPGATDRGAVIDYLKSVGGIT